MPAIRDIAVAFGETSISNDELRDAFPSVDLNRIAAKTGIESRRVASSTQSAADLATTACRELLTRHSPSEIDGLVYVTQSPEYFLPSTACILQDRLGLRTNTACFDINLGCSGYVYGLAVASGILSSSAVSRLLLVTSDTMTKYLDPNNLQTRILFGDGASATLMEAGYDRTGPFDLHTDGSGAPLLRCPPTPVLAHFSEGPSSDIADQQYLLMDGAGIFTFTLREVPRSVEAYLKSHNRTFADYDHVVFHQANEFVINQLSSRMAIPAEKVVRYYRDIGNLASTSIPAAMCRMKPNGPDPDRPERWLLIGFGVGLSWAVGEVIY
jgi:3-oxoacyl-[acyl-carrier-protein] synthase-3